MLDRTSLQALPAYDQLPSAGKLYVRTAFDGPPARAVGEMALRNVTGSYASPKFRYVTDYESAGCEKVYLLSAIVDGDVVELLSQPPALTVVRSDRRARKRKQEYVPDYLEVRADGMTVVEAKTGADLERLAATYDDWTRRSDGRWTFQPAAEECARLGLGFRIFCPDELPTAYRTNLQILSRLPKDDLLQAAESVVRLIKRRLEKRPCTLGELASCADGITGALVYQAILRGDIWGDLQNQHFDLDFVLYRDQSAAITRRPDPEDMSRVNVGPLHKRLLACNAAELDAANRALARYDERRKRDVRLNTTDYRDRARLRAAEEEGAPRLAAFVRRIGDRGSCRKLLPESIHQLMGQHAERYLQSGGPPNVSRMYADFLEQSGLPRGHLPSKESYRKKVHGFVGPERAAFMSGGKRAFHAAKARTDGAQINAQLAIAGLRIQIDGVYGDVRSAKDKDQAYQRPIIYPMADDVTGYILARGIKLGRASSFASLMALRDCYLRNGFLPAQVHTDRGSEFTCAAFRDACAYFGVGHELRPAGAPRSGGMSEMLNAQLSAFLQSLVGGMYFDKAGRSADGSKKSRRTAALTVEEIITKVDEWLFQVWNKTPFGSNKTSPEEAWLASLKVFSEAVVPTVDTVMARYQTSYPLSARKVDPVVGLRFGDQGYSAAGLLPALRSGDKPTRPRLDCLDPSIIWVSMKGGPQGLRSTRYQFCQGLQDAQLLAQMKDLLEARTTAVGNQTRRLMQESRLREDALKTAAANAAPEGAYRAVVADVSISEDPDFTGAMDGLAGGLLRKIV